MRGKLIWPVGLAGLLPVAQQVPTFRFAERRFLLYATAQFYIRRIPHRTELPLIGTDNALTERPCLAKEFGEGAIRHVLFLRLAPLSGILGSVAHDPQPEIPVHQQSLCRQIGRTDRLPFHSTHSFQLS